MNTVPGANKNELSSLERLVEQIEKEEDGDAKLPPVHRWDPPFCGEIDMEIRRNGDWYYLGGQIKRPALVKLFSNVLKRDNDRYVLVTPVEKVGIRVEDAPFHIATVERLQREGQQFIRMLTTTGDRVVLSATHPLTLKYRGEEPAPYIRVREGLPGLIGRNAYYQLIDWGQERVTADGQTELVIESAGQQFVIGHY
ncbi:MAG: DUF1285 domain-containing protein [Moraxellaceae bacterium]|nr:DUF1285 domain-containing protein [Moraxellaceae bacterium]